MVKKSDIVSAKTNQNFYNEYPIEHSKLKALVGKRFSLWDVKQLHKEVSLISFSSRKKTNKEELEKELVLAIEKGPVLETIKGKQKKTIQQYYIKTGLYAGRITVDDVTFDIKPDCNDSLYKRMLNFANHIYVDKNTESGDKDKDSDDFPVIKYLFLNSLQKVSVLGLPQEYSKRKYHDMNVHGGVDVQNYIKRDIPFTGRISSQKNERHYVQDIVDVLYFALKACDKTLSSDFQRLNLIKNELCASFSGKFPTAQTIKKAQSHRVLNNPMFADFKDTLQFAELVIYHENIIPNSEESKSKMSGYLLDIASLWEVYLERLLSRNLGEWRLSAQEELKLYNGCFFERSNYPDLVLRKKDDPSKVVVLDAKFKKMRLKNEDVDRNDLHQIHSYAGYYRENGDTVVLCGLIYPLSLEKPVNNEENLYGLDKPKTLFVIDGIYKGKKSKQENSQKTDDNAGKPAEDENSVISEELDKEYSYVKAEEAFIKRMQNYLNKSVKNLEENQ
ncbi:hypothetical protein [Fibrobacter sp.]|uniref:5-methylcytosine restriction system specificity protein McrC n=1 Tax=Fibrobacter sp. TaxID=35828 RepID=UPI0025BC1977|nr:hypothetical protein [Fibrobacter sp.]MBR4008789.1 hypothetical protein [Fibrobacter sp.]